MIVYWSSWEKFLFEKFDACVPVLVLVYIYIKLPILSLIALAELESCSLVTYMRVKEYDSYRDLLWNMFSFKA